MDASRDLAGARLRSVGLLLAGAVCELAGSRWTLALLIAGYVLLLAFAVRNLAVTGMVLVGFGLLANLVVIAVDDGMPVRGIPAAASSGPRHHGIGPDDQLVGLGDVIHLGPLGDMVSPGDIVLSVGVATVTAGLMRPRRRTTPARG